MTLVRFNSFFIITICQMDDLIDNALCATRHAASGNHRNYAYTKKTAISVTMKRLCRQTFDFFRL